MHTPLLSMPKCVFIHTHTHSPMDTLWETQGSVTFPRILQLVDWNGSNNQASVFLVLAQSRDLRGDLHWKLQVKFLPSQYVDPNNSILDWLRPGWRWMICCHDKWSEQLKGEEKKEIKKPIKKHWTFCVGKSQESVSVLIRKCYILMH